jgi:phosphate transport system ATP-binding protein
MTPEADPDTADRPIVEVRELNVRYGTSVALRKVSLDIFPREVTALIGPSGCGKSTFLRCLNRMNELIEDVHMDSGTIRINGLDIYLKTVDVTVLRRLVGMVFQESNPFPKTIYENVAYGLRLQGAGKKALLDERIERCLRDVALWDEVKDRLNENALGLSRGQQQRLCFARALAVGPEVLLLDEPCSALDPIGTARIEELINQLKKDYTIIIVTHNMQQAARVSDRTAFFNDGQVVEYAATDTIYMNPSNPQTEAYISGRFG